MNLLHRRHILVMGVSGSGKSTLASALATRLGSAFIEGDDLHPAENIAKMRAGHPLDDQDRAPWLTRCAKALAAEPAGVLACSALRRRYRDRLRQTLPDLTVLHAALPEPILARRLADRRGHFMPPSLLLSQLASLEPPEASEGHQLDGTLPPDQLLAAALVALG